VDTAVLTLFKWEAQNWLGTGQVISASNILMEAGRRLLSIQPDVYGLTVNTAKWLTPSRGTRLKQHEMCLHIVSRSDIIHGKFEQHIEGWSNYNKHTRRSSQWRTDLRPAPWQKQCIHVGGSALRDNRHQTLKINNHVRILNLKWVFGCNLDFRTIPVYWVGQITTLEVLSRMTSRKENWRSIPLYLHCRRKYLCCEVAV
jgi:hypothetical protein